MPKRESQIKFTVTRIKNMWVRRNWRGKVVSPEYGYEGYIFDKAGPLSYVWADTEVEAIENAKTRVLMFEEMRAARRAAVTYTVEVEDE